MTATIIIISVILAFVLFTFFMRARLKNIPVVDDAEKIITLTDKNFQHQIKGKTILVDFWAAWCAPCRMMAPVLNELSGELDQASIGKLNIDEYQSIAARYNVRSIPTMIIFKDGKEVDRIVGVKSREFLLKQINKVK
ncbi:MAG TPA: thioredoxin [Bacteroidales bacterium]|nr:thioredoxin [Bacteroidales bacterium]HPT12067.1 thioredoxin [Bacteroidales bacterium]